MAAGLSTNTQIHKTQETTEEFKVKLYPFSKQRNSSLVNEVDSIAQKAVKASPRALISYYKNEYKKTLGRISNIESFNNLTQKVNKMGKDPSIILNSHSIIPFNKYLKYVNADISFIVKATNLLHCQIAYKEIAEATKIKVKTGLLSNKEGENLLIEADDIFFIGNDIIPLSLVEIDVIKEYYLDFAIFFGSAPRKICSLAG